MTLIAASRVSDGIVIHADSQETFGDCCVEVNKIQHGIMGDFQVIVAGAGSPGPLVDTFQPRLTDAVNKAEPCNVGEFASIASKMLRRFYKEDIALCPDTDKDVSYLIAACHLKTGAYQAWTTSNIYLTPLPEDEPRLIGWDVKMYVSIAKRLYSPTMTIPQAILAGVYLLSFAEETCSWIKGPIRIAVVGSGGITIEDSDYARRMEERLKLYERQVNKIFLACSDTTLSTPALEDAINEFRQTTLDIHRDQIDDLATKATLLDLMHSNPFRKLPRVPAVMLDKGFLVEHDREKIGRVDRERDASEAWVKAHKLEYLTKHVVCSKCSHAFEAKTKCGGPHDHHFTGSCPNCTEAYQVEWLFESGSFS